MSRMNTIGYGSRSYTSKTLNGSSRQGSDPGAAPESFEARWFTKPTPTTPIGEQLMVRRGWSPPPPSKGLAFAGVSLVLVTMAIGGTAFFLSAPESKHPASVSTTTVTHADLPMPGLPPPNVDTPAPVQTITPKDLPTAAPERPVTQRASNVVRAPAPAVKRAPTPRAAPTPRGTAKAPAAAPTTAEASLPNLDRAAAAAATAPGAAVSSSPDESPTTSPTTSPTPPETPPEFELQR